MPIPNAKRARRAQAPEVDADIRAFFEGGPPPNSIKYFMDGGELRALWETHREQMSPSAEREFRRIAAAVDVELGGE